MEWYHIYLWTRLDVIQTVFGVSVLVFGACLVVCTIVYVLSLMEDAEEATKLAKHGIKLCTLWLFIFLVPFIFAPSSKDFAMMYVIPKIANSKVIQQDLPDIYEMAINGLKDRLTIKEKKEE
jgi:hypothetical protein